MKLQSLAVIFVIIILPISLVMSEYIQLQLDSVVLMGLYDAHLNDATYDAIRAYQLNEQNATTDKIGNEKVRDIEAAIKTFYASLSNALGTEGYTEEDLKPYVPAMVFTLYNGYYIYGPYRELKNESELTYGLKPFIAYSEQYYKDSSNSVVINYTLDNYITVYGILDGKEIHTGGYVVDPNTIQILGDSAKVKTLSGDVTISKENLEEISGADVMLDTDDIPVSNEQPYKYVNQRDKKNVYYNEGSIRSRQKVTRGEFEGSTAWLQFNVNKTYSKYSFIDKNIVNEEEKAEIDDINRVSDESAVLYYRAAKDFYEDVIQKLDWVKPSNAKNIASVTYANENTPIFDNLTGVDGVDSAFNSHRRDVIRKSIESNLRSSIEVYNSDSQAAGITDVFRMPRISEKDWEKILNNVSVITFLQNIVMKNNYQKYSGYSVITNNQNKDYTDPTQIYIYDKTNNLVHKASCEKLKDPGLGDVIAYKNTDFLRQNLFNGEGQSMYFYKHYSSMCYECLVSTSGNSDYSIEEVLKDTAIPQKVRNAYYTALAREKYNTDILYKDWFDKYDPTE